MELKLSQRIILKYYRTKIHVLERVSPEKAGEYIMQLFFTPSVKQKGLERPAIFHKAEKLSFNFHGNMINGFRWNANVPGARTILVCHGMNSCSYRFEKYIQSLLLKHFNVLAFDAQAHGLSQGKILNAVVYSEMMIEIEKMYGPVHGILAHSIAGMAAAFAMEKLNDENKKVVIIAPATETLTAVDNFFSLLHLNDSLKKNLYETVEKVRGLPAEWFSVTRAIQTFKSPVLWIHDMNDTMCPYKDTLAVQQMKLPHVQFITTHGLGHNKIYRDKDVHKKVVDFLTG